MKRKIFFILTAFLIYVFFEGSCLAGLYFLKTAKGVIYEPVSAARLSSNQKKIIQKLLERKNNYSAYNSILGWGIKPNGATRLYQANAQGIRSDREYAKIPPVGITRIISFGDSFTHGDNVKLQETWQRQLEQNNSNIEVLNFGVPGYGLDQAFLYYQQVWRNYDAPVVLIGYMSENIYRHVNIFRPFYNPRTRFPLTKPRFLENNNQWVHFRNPFSKLEDYKKLLKNEETVLFQLGKQDHYYKMQYYKSVYDFLPSVRMYKIARSQLRLFFQSGNKIEVRGYYNPNSEAFKVTIHLLEKFYTLVQENNSTPVVIIFPDQYDLVRYKKNKTKVYEPLLKLLHGKGITYIDMMDAFEKNKNLYTSEDELFIGDHYAPLGNKIIALHIMESINQINVTSVIK